MLQHLPFVLFLCVRWGVHAREWVIGSKDNLQESVPSFPMGPSNQTQGSGLNSRHLLHAGPEQQAFGHCLFQQTSYNKQNKIIHSIHGCLFSLSDGYISRCEHCLLG